MTVEQIIGLTLTLLIMSAGAIGSVLPLLPGVPIVLLAAIGHRLYFGSASVGNLMLCLLVALTVISLVVDYVATAKGAKKFGATWRGALGAIVGGIVGIFFNLPGIILGPFLGALAFEMIGGYKLKKAANAGLGATIGLVFGAVAKLAISLAMMGLFAANVVWASFNH